MELVQEERMPAEKPDERVILPATIDRYANLKAELSRLDSDIEQAEIPFGDEIRDAENRMYEATKGIAAKRDQVFRKITALEREILAATEGQDACYLNGTDKGTIVKVKRSFMRKVDADGLHNLLLREGLVEHYDYLFKRSVTIRDFEGALKQPLFPMEAKSFVEMKVRSEKVEVM